MSEIVIGLISFLVIIALIFYFMWRDEKSKKEYLEQLLFRLDKKIDLLNKVEPTYYVPSRHHNISPLMQAKTSDYRDCVDYEQLQVAVRNGGYTSK